MIVVFIGLKLSCCQNNYLDIISLNQIIIVYFSYFHFLMHYSVHYFKLLAIMLYVPSSNTSYLSISPPFFNPLRHSSLSSHDKSNSASNHSPFQLLNQDSTYHSYSFINSKTQEYQPLSLSASEFPSHCGVASLSLAVATIPLDQLAC